MTPFLYIEVRSSFCYRLKNPEDIINKISAYGWYTSQNKSIEHESDWYWQVVYHMKPDKSTQTHLRNFPIFSDEIENNSIQAYVCGGGSRKLFEKHKHNIRKDDQLGAEYVAISPIFNANDCSILIKEMLNLS